MPPSPQHTGKQSFDKAPFLTSIDDLSSEIETIIEIGLTEVKVQERPRCYGPNKLSSENGAVWYTVLLKQISNAMILVRLQASLANPLAHLACRMARMKCAVIDTSIWLGARAGNGPLVWDNGLN